MIHKHTVLNDELLKFIVGIEGNSYPLNMQAFQDADVEDIRELCGGLETTAFTGSTWYCLIALHSYNIEVCDLAGRLTFGELINLLAELKVLANGREVKADLRRTTSWRLIQAAAKRGRVTITREEPWMWGNEEMVYTVFTIN